MRIYCHVIPPNNNDNKCAIYAAPADYWDAHHCREYFGPDDIKLDKDLLECGASGCVGDSNMFTDSEEAANGIVEKLKLLDYSIDSSPDFDKWAENLDRFDDDDEYDYQDVKWVIPIDDIWDKIKANPDDFREQRVVAESIYDDSASKWWISIILNSNTPDGMSVDVIFETEDSCRTENCGSAGSLIMAVNAYIEEI